LVVGLLGSSCAISEAPPGGPEDKTPPVVSGTEPANASTGVRADTKVAITFSEKMTAARFERAFDISPRATIAKAHWKKDTVVLEFEEALHPDTTYVFRLKSGYADAHNVRSERPFEFAFATSAEIDTGSIAGRIYFRRKPTGKAVVRLFVLQRDSSFTPESARADREITTDEDGAYELKYLPARSVPFLVWAFQDGNGNGVFEAESEAAAVLEDTVMLERGRPRVEREDVYIVDPKEPGAVAGRVVNETPLDSILVTVTLAELSDSLPPTYCVRADSKGRFSFGKVLKGLYSLHAFIDLEKDSLCGTYACTEDSTARCPEYCVTYPESVLVAPGDNIQLKDVRLEGRARKEE
jgi:hypothetical protein